MMGSTHKLIGIYTGILLAVFSFYNKETMWLLMAIMVPAGAMLPDIDHNSTKLGRKRKAVMDVVSRFGLAALFMVGIILIVLEIQSGGLRNAIGRVGQLLLAVAAVLILSSEPMKKKFKFLRKHRGIMHTLFVPAVLFYLAKSVVTSQMVSYLLLGVNIGYLTHLFADCLTKGGCPVLWPFYSKPIHLTNIATNTVQEKVAAVFACVCITGVILVSVTRILG